MSEEIYKQPEFQPDPHRPKATPKKNNKWIYLAIIGLLIVTNIITVVKYSNVSKERDIAQSDFEYSDSTREAVQVDYNAALARLDELVSKNSQMDSMINDRDGEIAKLRKQIDAIVTDKNATKQQLAKASRLIKTLNDKVYSYEERIAQLEVDNERLGNENTTLTSERDSAMTQNIGLSQKVRLASVLHASNIRMTPIDLRRGGKKLKETSKANRTDVLRILFDIDENRIAESGRKDIYLKITGPQGRVLSNAAYGSGVTETYDGKPLNFTLYKKISLEQGKPVNDVVIDWNQDSDYEKGNYNIEIYHEGYMIGSGSVYLK